MSSDPYLFLVFNHFHRPIWILKSVRCVCATVNIKCWKFLGHVQSILLKRIRSSDYSVLLKVLGPQVDVKSLWRVLGFLLKLIIPPFQCRVAVYGSFQLLCRQSSQPSSFNRRVCVKCCRYAASEELVMSCSISMPVKNSRPELSL